MTRIRLRLAPWALAALFAAPLVLPAQQVAVVSAASFNADRTVAPGAIASAFGQNLAGSTLAATAVPLPTTLAGASVEVVDLALRRHACPLFFVSPGQVNFLVPEGAAVGPATVRITSGGTTQSGQFTIANVAPGLFTQTLDEWAAGFVLRVAANGAQTMEPIYELRNGRIEPRRIQMSPNGDESSQVYLILYGTGVRRAGGAGAVSVFAGMGANVGAASERIPTLFAAAQGGFEGLDQINAGPLNRLLEAFGGGDRAIRVTTGGRSSNVAWFEVAENPNAPVISNPFFRLNAGSPPTLLHEFDFRDRDGDLGPFNLTLSWVDAQRICTTTRTLGPGPFTGQTAGRVSFTSNKGSGTQLGAIQSVTIIVSDAHGHLSPILNHTISPPGSLPGFQEQCDSVIPR